MRISALCIFVCVIFFSTYHSQELVLDNDILDILLSANADISNIRVIHLAQQGNDEEIIQNSSKKESDEPECDELSSTGDCIHSFKNITEMNQFPRLFEFIDRMVNCSRMVCVVRENETMIHQSDIGNPNAQFTMSFFYKYGMFGYPVSPLLSSLYQRFALERHNLLAILAEQQRRVDSTDLSIDFSQLNLSPSSSSAHSPRVRGNKNIPVTNKKINNNQNPNLNQRMNGNGNRVIEGGDANPFTPTTHVFTMKGKAASISTSTHPLSRSPAGAPFSSSVSSGMSTSSSPPSSVEPPPSLFHLMRDVYLATHTFTHSLFQSLFDAQVGEWPINLEKESYELEDVIDVMRSQISEENYRILQERVALQTKNYEALVNMYKQDMRYDYFYGYLLLEGIKFPRNYEKAYSVFSNDTVSQHNSTYHVFGRAVMQFYGLNGPVNRKSACALIDECSTTKAGIGNGVIRYFGALCELERGKLSDAFHRMQMAAAQNSDHAMKHVLYMMKKSIGVMSSRAEAEILLAPFLEQKLKIQLLPMINIIRQSVQSHSYDQSLIYSLLATDINLPYSSNHITSIISTILDDRSPKFHFCFPDMTAAVTTVVYWLESAISYSPHSTQLLHTYSTILTHSTSHSLMNEDKVMRILRSAKDERNTYAFMLGYLMQKKGGQADDWLSSKMYFDKSIQSNQKLIPSLFYRAKLFVKCIGHQVMNGSLRNALRVFQRLFVFDHSDVVFSSECDLITRFQPLSAEELSDLLSNKAQKRYRMGRN